MPQLERIVVVDDDPSVRDALSEYLTRHGYAVGTAADGREMDRLLTEYPCDVVVLDLMIPGEDGLQICRRLTARGQPVLILSAIGDTTDRIVGLEIGADDYLAKPFDPRELLARIRVILRRKAEAPTPAEKRFEFDGWLLDVQARTLRSAAGKEIALTRGEFQLLQLLVERPGRVLTRNTLLELIQGADVRSFDRAIDLAVSRLRRKLRFGGGADFIQTLRGEGYRFNARVRRH